MKLIVLLIALAWIVSGALMLSSPERMRELWRNLFPAGRVRKMAALPLLLGCLLILGAFLGNEVFGLCNVIVACTLLYPQHFRPVAYRDYHGIPEPCPANVGRKPCVAWLSLKFSVLAHGPSHEGNLILVEDRIFNASVCCLSKQHGANEGAF